MFEATAFQVNVWSPPSPSLPATAKAFTSPTTNPTSEAVTDPTTGAVTNPTTEAASATLPASTYRFPVVRLHAALMHGHASLEMSLEGGEFDRWSSAVKVLS